MSVINVHTEGFNELVSAFRQIGDFAKQERLIKSAQKRSTKYYRTALSTYSRSIANSTNLANGFTWRRLRGNNKWIESMWGPHTKMEHPTAKIKGRKMTMAGFAGIRNRGKGYRATHFIDRAFDRTNALSQRAYKMEVKRAMGRAIKRAGISPGIYREI